MAEKIKQSKMTKDSQITKNDKLRNEKLTGKISDQQKVKEEEKGITKKSGSHGC